MVELGKVDCAVNNAGIARHVMVPLAEIVEEARECQPVQTQIVR